MKLLKELTTLLFMGSAIAATQPAMAARVDMTLIGQFTIGDRRGENFAVRIGYESDTAATGSNGSTTIFMNAGDIFTITVGGTTTNAMAMRNAFGDTPGYIQGGTVYDLSPPRGEVESTQTYRRVSFTDPVGSIARITFLDHTPPFEAAAAKLPDLGQLAEFDTREFTFCDAGLCGTGTFNYFPFPGAVPEPGTWAMIIIGFGMVGGTMRVRRRNISVPYTL